MEKIRKILLNFVNGLEVVIALLIVVGVSIGLYSVVRYLVLIPQSEITEMYDVFKTFLSMALLLIIGIELVLMLLTHSAASVLELVLFAIARKMLVYSETMLELLIATAAIAIVFGTKRYLIDSKYSLRKDKNLSSSIKESFSIGNGKGATTQDGNKERTPPNNF